MIRFLRRAALVPLAFVTVLGACGDDFGVSEEGVDVEPIQAPDPKTAVGFVPGAANITFEALPPVETIIRRSPFEDRVGKPFDRRQFNLRTPIPFDLDNDFIDNLVAWPVDAGVEVADAGVEVADAGVEDAGCTE